MAGCLFYYSSRRYRALTLRNLRLAYGQERSLPELRKLARQTCQRTIANFLGTLKTTILPTKKVMTHLTLEGEKPVFNHIKNGQGAILVLGHMGNWEVLNRLPHYLPPGGKGGGIYQPLKNPLVNRLLLRRRTQDGSYLFSKKGGFHTPATFVKEGGLLAVVADQKAGRSGASYPFFGRLSSISPLPAILARKAKTPVFAVGIETARPGHWRAVFEPLGIAPETHDIIISLEKLISQSPADYLWLHNRWRLDGRAPLSLRCRPTKTAPPSRSTTPLRFLILTDHQANESALLDYLDLRLASDLPLAPEFLELTKLEQSPQAERNSIPYHLSTANTAEQLAAQIRNIDFSQPHPLELIVVSSFKNPHLSVSTAARLAQIPRVVSNPSRKSLEELLKSLTIALRKPQP
jgi:KDO2-lipid IV(A) lauroyltransferase